MDKSNFYSLYMCVYLSILDFYKVEYYIIVCCKCEGVCFAANTKLLPKGIVVLYFYQIKWFPILITYGILPIYLWTLSTIPNTHTIQQFQ